MRQRDYSVTVVLDGETTLRFPDIDRFADWLADIMEKERKRNEKVQSVQSSEA